MDKLFLNGFYRSVEAPDSGVTYPAMRIVKGSREAGKASTLVTDSFMLWLLLVGVSYLEI